MLISEHQPTNRTNQSNMSRVISNKTKNTQKKCCVVCRSAGKTESEWQSHFVRESQDPNSRIVCPTLLQHACEYCGKKGHTRTYCRSVKTNSSVKINNSVPVKETKKETKKTQEKNRFTALCDDESDFEKDSDEETSEPVKKPHPPSPKNIIMKYNKNIKWADVESSDDEDDAESYFK